MQSRRERLARLRRLEAFITKHRNVRPWLPGTDPLVPGTAAWIARKLASAQANHARIFLALKLGAVRRLAH